MQAFEAEEHQLDTAEVPGYIVAPKMEAVHVALVRPKTAHSPEECSLLRGRVAYVRPFVCGDWIGSPGSCSERALSEGWWLCGVSPSWRFRSPTRPPRAPRSAGT